MEIRGRYRAHCYFRVGWVGRNNIPDNRQDFLSCKQFVEWLALLSMNVYRGSTGYSMNINKLTRTRPARGCDQQLEQPMFTTREMHKLSASIFSLFASSDLLLVSPLVDRSTTSSNNVGGFDQRRLVRVDRVDKVLGPPSERGPRVGCLFLYDTDLG